MNEEQLIQYGEELRKYKKFKESSVKDSEDLKDETERLKKTIKQIMGE